MRLLLPIVFAIGLLGCPERKIEPTAAQDRPIAPNAPLDVDKPDTARVQLDLANVRSAITKHRQIEGSHPKSIVQLGVKLFYPDDLVYDESNGTVKSKTYPMF